MNIILELKTSCTLALQLSDTSDAIEDALFGGGDVITKEAGYDMCIVADGTSYIVIATSGDKTKTLTMTANGIWTGK